LSLFVVRVMRSRPRYFAYQLKKALKVFEGVFNKEKTMIFC